MFRPVYFSALMDSKLKCYDCNFHYTKVLANEGGGLDSGSGVFTAPQPGSYFFQVVLDNDDVDIFLNH